MKKILSYMMALVAIVCMAACSTELDKQCEALTADLTSENWEALATKCDAIYQQKAECSAKNYAVLTCMYQILAVKETTDAVKKYTYVQRVVECYEAGVAKDASVMEANLKAAKLENMGELVAQYKAGMSEYEAQATAQQNGGAEAEEAEGEEGEEAEEATEEEGGEE